MSDADHFAVRYGTVFSEVDSDQQYEGIKDLGESCKCSWKRPLESQPSTDGESQGLGFLAVNSGRE